MTLLVRQSFVRAAAGLALLVALGGLCMAQEGVKPKSPLGPSDKAVESDIARYCANVAPTASEARIAFQMKHLLELESRITHQLDALDAKQADARAWVTKRDAMLKSATDDVVAIYAKMSAEAASSQIGAMEDNVAAAILTKLSPKAASLILGEMEAGKAARLTSLMAGATSDERKS